MIRADEPAIVFMDKDARRLHYPHDDAIVITLAIANYTTRRVLIDNGSSADIFYYPAFQQRPPTTCLLSSQRSMACIGEIQGDQLAIRECYLVMLSMDE